MMRSRFFFLLLLAGTLSSVHAHPGHGPLDHGPAHLLLSWYHLLMLGASGLAMARWCVRQGARVTVADTRETPPQLARLQAELPQVDFRAGAFEADPVPDGVFFSPPCA